MLRSPLLVLLIFMSVMYRKLSIYDVLQSNWLNSGKYRVYTGDTTIRILFCSTVSLDTHCCMLSPMSFWYCYRPHEWNQMHKSYVLCSVLCKIKNCTLIHCTLIFLCVWARYNSSWYVITSLAVFILIYPPTDCPVSHRFIWHAKGLCSGAGVTAHLSWWCWAKPWTRKVWVTNNHHVCWVLR